MTTASVLAIDIGTSSCRAALFDEDARQVRPLAREDYSPSCPEPGASEFDADELVAAAIRCIDGALAERAPTEPPVAAVGVAAFWHSMVGVDADGRAVTPLYTWADTRPGACASQLLADPAAALSHRRTGCPIHASYFPARLRWLRARNPDKVGLVSRWVSPAEHLEQRVLGRARLSVSMASGTGLLDVRSSRLDAPMLATAGIGPGDLNPLVDLDAPTASVLPEYQRRWPALGQAAWIPAIGDGAAGNVGSGCVTAHTAALNLGTSGAIRVLSADPAPDPPDDLWCYRLDRFHPLVGAAFSDGGNLIAWLRNLLAGLPRSDAEFEHALDRMAPCTHGLTILPALHGERWPGWRPEASAVFAGIRAGCTPLHILRAAMEAVALRFALAHRALKARYPGLRQVIASGGALNHSRVWSRILADALGYDLLVLADQEATCRGAAVAALAAVGAVADLSRVPRPAATTVRHDPGATDAYRGALLRQQDLYVRVRRVPPS